MAIMQEVWGLGELISLFIPIYKVAPAAFSGLRRIRGNYGNGGEISPSKHRLVKENNLQTKDRGTEEKTEQSFDLI